MSSWHPGGPEHLRPAERRRAALEEAEARRTLQEAARAAAIAVDDDDDDDLVHVWDGAGDGIAEAAVEPTPPQVVSDCGAGAAAGTAPPIAPAAAAVGSVGSWSGASTDWMEAAAPPGASQQAAPPPAPPPTAPGLGAGPARAALQGGSWGVHLGGLLSAVSVPGRSRGRA